MLLKKFSVIILAIFMLATLAACGGGSKYSSSSYSDQYYSDSKYRSNVDSSAKSWGVSSSELDSKLQAVARAAS